MLAPFSPKCTIRFLAAVDNKRMLKLHLLATKTTQSIFKVVNQNVINFRYNFSLERVFIYLQSLAPPKMITERDTIQSENVCCHVSYHQTNYHSSQLNNGNQD